MNSDIPASLADITPDWLSAAIGADVRSFTATPIGEGTGLMGELARLAIDYAPGAGGPPTLVAKVPTANSGLRSIATLFSFYHHEVGFYRDDPEAVGIRVPRCYHAAMDAEAGRFVLLLEDLSGGRTVDQLGGLNLDDTAVALRELAGLHATWWDHPRLDKLTWVIDPADPTFRGVYQAYTQMCDPFLERYSYLLTDADRHLARGISRRLFVSRGTVKTHLSHIFAKLGVATRSELASQATARDLRAAPATRT